MLPEVDLAPKGIGALLDDALALYRANAKTLAIASGVVFPFALIMSVANTFVLRGMLDVFTRFSPVAQPEQFSAAYAPTEAAAGIAYAAVPLLFLARLFLTAAVIAAVPAMLYRRPLDPKRLLRPGWKPVLALAGVQVLLYVGLYAVSIVGILIIVGLLVLPFVLPYVGVRLSVAGQIAVAEEASVPNAFRRSWRLTKGAFWRTCGFAISLGLVTYAVALAIQSPILIRTVLTAVNGSQGLFHDTSVFWKVAEGLLGALSVSLLVPFNALAWYRYYLDLRSRNEGMDLVVRAADIAEGATP